MFNRRLGVKPKPKAVPTSTVTEQSSRESTYKRPTKGVKLTKTESENLEKLTKLLRVETGENVTDNKTLRALTYLADDPNVVEALAEVIRKQLS
ncbi:hypothetical protein KCM76_20725 [Zooshikella marina]|uniref:hypothetical protein n=1 Tax=Zooshikella ganghwensis TaxID=202772 RepID=UPI001BB06301|nr:hypothetical protein [Zooshikella ganghwensis]MBU2708430.1 hypothetical protein [Zooshikella ganghwensis]